MIKISNHKDLGLINLNGSIKFHFSNDVKKPYKKIKKKFIILIFIQKKNKFYS